VQGAVEKLTLVVSSLGPGGAERVVATLANEWARRGRTVTLLTLDDGRSPFYALDRAVRHVPLGVTRLSRSWVDRVTSNARRILVLRRAIRASRPDLVLSFTDTTNVLVLCATRLSRLPVVVAEHSDPERHPLPRAWKRLRAVTYPWAASVVTPNAETRDLLPRRIRTRTMVIPNPVPAPAAAARADAAVDTRLVVSVGRLTEEKGHDLLLRAFARLVDRYPAWRLVIVGEGPLRPALEVLREQLALRDRVEFAGLVKDVRAILGRAELFVLPSRREVFPMALCEAMAFGIPPVATEYRPGVREIVRDGVDGVIVPAEDVPALAEGMARLMGDAVERRRLGARAVDIVQRYGVPRVMTMWEDLLHAVRRRAAR
jgi:GalNAc-alpha-(1->4)-GalNAc-alpha-(1->3)-diNAcBac-PP-undecaprenol alpha-1,4-N-acetyl-D-galactosaminyltransferase